MEDENKINEVPNEEPKKEVNKYTRIAVMLALCIGVIFVIVIILFRASFFPEAEINMSITDFYKPPHNGPGGYDLDLNNYTREIIVPDPEPNIIEPGIQQEVVVTPNSELRRNISQQEYHNCFTLNCSNIIESTLKHECAVDCSKIFAIRNND